MWPFKFAMRNKRGLPHMVLYLLSTAPKNGVELMDGVQQITRGWWRPTPGSIYPLLKEMTDQGLVKKRDDSRYELTEKGKGQSQGTFGPWRRGPQSPSEVVNQMDGLVSYFEDLKATQKTEFDPHKDKLRDVARRISALVSREDGGSERT